MKQLISTVALLLLASESYATVDCGPLKVTAIQVQKADVLVQVQGESWETWKSLGLHSESSTSSFQSVAQQAMATGDSVILRFPDGYDCMISDYTQSAQMIRIYK
ncbi:hypothetical protein [Microbulbifer epialgicus]|uniref:Uncharacterized protein n=1 Tax=Microbulbifer epialgicus TaxID=393907 RepID=A0ABV4P7H1_9GAMM